MKTKILFPVLATALIAMSTDVNAQATIGSNTMTGAAPNPTQYLGSNNAYDIVFKTSNAERMRVIHSSGNASMPNGNINIGPLINTTYTPISKVTINPALTANTTGDNLIGLSVAKQIINGYSRSIFFVPHLAGGYNWLPQSGDAGIFWTDGGNGVVGSGNQNATSGLIIAPHAGSYAGLRITSAGNVGIGTPLINNPNNYKLAVNGAIGAKAITIENTSTTWPDYVFDSKYKLKTLEEVEAFVNTHKHLPNVPSACEVEEKGINLGDMDAHLLEKIEELTLYLIQLKKENEELKKRVDNIEQQ